MGENLREIVAQFEAQDRYRQSRKGGNVLIHEMLSFHPEETTRLNREVLQTITEQYLSLRCPTGAAYAKPYYDKGHVHIHVIVSATNFNTCTLQHILVPHSL